MSIAEMNSAVALEDGTEKSAVTPDLSHIT